MTATEIVLTCIFGSLGYLLIGVVVAGVGGAVTTYGSEIQPGWWWSLLVWPAVVLFGIGVGVFVGTVPALKWISVHVARRLNPEIHGWKEVDW